MKTISALKKHFDTALSSARFVFPPNIRIIENMQSSEIRKRFLEFFKERGHVIVPSSSLIPSDPSVLLTTAGMQQFKPYYTGEADPVKDFGAKNTASIQKIFRTSDIDEVGDETHLTFFEMLGNFSFGGYGKKEAILYAHEFITKELGLEIDYVTVFEGDSSTSSGQVIPADEESVEIWKTYLPEEKIKKAGREDNFWGPTGAEGPCGPTTEIYIDDVEIWNIVFNEYYCASDGTMRKLPQLGVDTGMGFERLAMALQKKQNIFETDLFTPIVQKMGSIPLRSQRIIADHLRSAVFLIADGVIPSNKDRGYVLRRLIHRATLHLSKFQSLELIEDRTPFPEFLTPLSLAGLIIDEYAKIEEYASLREKKEGILDVLKAEQEKFGKKIRTGEEKLNKLIHLHREDHTYRLKGEEIFYLVATDGLPLEWIKDKAKLYDLELDVGGFEQEMEKHQETSRAGIEKKFGGHGLLLNTGELKAADEKEVKMVTRLHSATHLLQAALRKVLGKEVEQCGSDITASRLRFDFSFGRALTKEECAEVEKLVQDVIRRNYTVTIKKMSFADAIQSGALYMKDRAYLPEVNVYQFADQKTGEVFSSEVCGGPHVSRTGDIGAFRIMKQEAVGAGVRRIRAVAE